MEYNVHSNEKFYFKVMVFFSLLLYSGMVFAMFYTSRYLFYGVYMAVILLFNLLIKIYFVGYLRGNAIKVNGQQFPEVYEILKMQSEKLGLEKVPTMYLLQGHGMLNAFAARFTGHDYVILYSEVMAAAYHEGRSAVEFIIGHELGHIKRNHVGFIKTFLLFPARWIPFLSSAYSRACEYTCDAIGYSLCPEGAEKGILILAAGPKLYNKVNVRELLYNAQNERGFAVSFAELFSTHPHLVHRIERFEKLHKSDLPTNAYIMDRDKDAVRHFDQQ